jgi:hypothetical protein
LKGGTETLFQVKINQHINMLLGASKIEYHRLRNLSRTDLFPTVLEVGESKIKAGFSPGVEECWILTWQKVEGEERKKALSSRKPF